MEDLRYEMKNLKKVIEEKKQLEEEDPEYIEQIDSLIKDLEELKIRIKDSQ